MAGQALSGAASGAAAGSAIGPYGALAGGVLGLAGGFLADSSERKKLKEHAAMLEKQAKRRLEKGQQEADIITGQGQMDQTTYATSYLGRGGSRDILAQDSSLAEISNRAAYEANIALEQASYDAQQIRADSQAMREDAEGNTAASILNGANTILSIYGSYNKADIASKAGNDRALPKKSTTDNYRRPY